MGVGRQSRQVCFGAKPDKGFLDLKSRRTRKWYGEANESWWLEPRRESWWLEPRRESWWLEPRRGELVVGQETGSWWPDRIKGSCGWTGERRTAEVGVEERRELRLDKREANREVGVDSRRGSQHQTPEQRGEETR